MEKKNKKNKNNNKVKNTSRSSSAGSSPDVEYSIIVPTYKECANLQQLVSRVFDALQRERLSDNTEMIVVDDNSNDGSVEEVERLRKQYNYNVRIEVRNERGLSSAVLHGFDKANGNILICMDADLQHPPEKVPPMILSLSQHDDVEFVLGTRYGGDSFAVDKDWPLYRRMISKTARLLARPLTPLSDPMSGFFGIRRETYRRAVVSGNVSSIGFKIGLELYVKAGIKKHREVSIVFGLRQAGESKLTGKVMVMYLQHLMNLYGYTYPYTWVGVVAVGVLVVYVLWWLILGS